MAEVLEIPKSTAVVEGSTLKQLLKKRITKSVKFMGQDILIHKLSVNEINKLQESEESLKSEALEKGVKEGIAVTIRVVRMGWAGASEWTDEEIQDLAFEELLSLANEIMTYSGVAAAKVGESK